MSSRKEERKESTSRSSFSEDPSTTSIQENFAEYRDNLNKVLEETRANIKKSIEETRTQIPRYTNAISEYQEQIFQTAREIADNCMNSQREILNSSQSTLSPYVENVNRFTNYWTSSPKALASAYVRVAGNYADNVIVTTKLVNNMVFANVEAYKTTLQHAADNSKELLKVGVNTAKTFEQISKNTV